MSPLRGIPTSRAYWELKAEQVMNRVFEPEQPIEVEICDTNPTTAFTDPAQSKQLDSIPVELHDLAASPGHAANRPEPTAHVRQQRSNSNRTTSWMGRPSLSMAIAGGSVVVVSMASLTVLTAWNQSQQAIRQERNMLLIERLRTLGPGTAASSPDAEQAAATPVEAGKDGELPPPPPGEPWMEELASLPASSAPTAGVLRVPVNSRITNPAPAASSSGSNSGGRDAGVPELVGVVQVPGRNGSAIFQIGTSSTSAAVGESIGGTGWRLLSANGDGAVIEKGGEQRRMNISSGL